jgi:hypothetical protein
MGGVPGDVDFGEGCRGALGWEWKIKKKGIAFLREGRPTGKWSCEGGGRKRSDLQILVAIFVIRLSILH